MAEKKKAAAVFTKEFLDSKRLTSQQIADHLQSLWEQLKTLANVADDMPKAEAIARSLLQPALVSHESLAGRLHTAACAIDVIRICAPQPPYEGEEINVLFELFIKVFERLSLIDAAEGHVVSYILEHLSATRAAVLISDEADIRLRLFKTFFDNIRKEHSSAVSIHMLEIMAAIIEEADELDSDLVQYLLETLLEGSDKGGKAAQELAGRLIRRSADALRAGISQFIADTWLTAQADKELREQIHRLVFELFWIKETLIVDLLPNLEAELESEELGVREQPVRILAVMFSAKESNLAREHPKLFTTFLRRFKDMNVALRQVMITDFAHPYLTNHSEGQNAVLVNGGLADQLVDVDEACRLAALKVVFAVGSSTPRVLTEKVVVNTLSRLLDRKATVRLAAIEGLAKLYSDLVKRFGLPHQWEEGQDQVYGTIPNALLNAYIQSKRRDMEENVAVEKALSATVFALSEEVDENEVAALLFHITRAQVDDRARKALRTLFVDKRKFRDALSTYLKNRSAIDIENIKELDSRTLANVSSHLPFNSSLEMMKKFHAVPDKSLFNNLAVLLEPQNSKERQTTAKEKIQSSAKSGARQATYYEAILQRLDPLLSKEHVNSLLTLLEARIEVAIHPTPSKKGKKRAEVEMGERESAELSALLEFSEALSKSLPFLFADSLDHLAKLIPIDNEEFTPRILTIAANAAGQFRLDPDSTNPLLRPLTAHILEGKVTAQVRAGIICLHNMFEPAVTTSIFQRLVDNYLKALRDDDLRLGALKTLKEMAQYSYEHVEAVFNEVFHYVLDELIPLQPIDADPNADEPSDLAMSKTAGLSFIRTLLVQMAVNAGKKNEALPEDIMAKAASFVAVTFAIIGNEGYTNFSVAGPKEKSRGKQVKLGLSTVDNEANIVVDKEGETASEIDRENLRARSAIQALKLIEGRIFEKYINPARFTVLSQITVDTVFEVRQAFLRALDEGLALKEHDLAMLPVKYLALVIPFGADREDELRAESKSVLTKAIAFRRAYLRSRLAASAKGDIEKEKRLQWSTAPENCVAYAIATLANLKTYEADSQSGFVETAQSMKMLVDVLLTGEHDSIDFVKSVLEIIPHLENSVNPSSTAIYAVAEILTAVVERFEQLKKLTVRTAKPQNLSVPPVFRPLTDKKQIARNKMSHLPLEFDVVKALAKVKEAKPKKTPAKRSKRAHKSSDEAESSSIEKESEEKEKHDEDAMDIDAPPATKPTPKKRAPPKVDQPSESDKSKSKSPEKEKGDEEEFETKRPRQRRSTSFGTKKAAPEEEKVDKEEEKEEGDGMEVDDGDGQAEVVAADKKKKKPAVKRKLESEEIDEEAKEAEPPAKKAKVANPAAQPKAKEFDAFPIEEWMAQDATPTPKKTPTKGNGNGNKKRAEKEEVQDDAAEEVALEDSATKRPVRKRKALEE